MKIIAGHSTENSISFASNRVKITLYDDYKVEYLPFVKKEKKTKNNNKKSLEDKIMMCDQNSLRAKYLLFIKKIKQFRQAKGIVCTGDFNFHRFFFIFIGQFQYHKLSPLYFKQSSINLLKILHKSAPIPTSVSAKICVPNR